MLESQAALVEYLMAHPDFLRITLHEEQAWGVSPEHKTAEQTAMWREGMQGTILGIREGIRAGLFVDDDPEVMARTLLAMQQAHLGYWLEDGRRRSRDIVVTGLQRQFMRAFCRPEVLLERGLPGDADATAPVERAGDVPQIAKPVAARPIRVVSPERRS
jgi:hypothetical protein